MTIKAKKAHQKKRTNATNAPKRFFAVQKIISIGFLVVFSIILIHLLCLNWLQYCANRNFLLPNIVALIISLLIGGLFYFFFRKIQMSERQFKIIVIITFLIIFLAQLVFLYFSYFKTAWDAGLVNSIANQAAEEGPYTSAGSNVYLTKFPNNIFIVSILAFIKSLPIIGSHYFTILAFNAIMVNLAGLFTCLTLRKLISEKAGIMSIIIVTPLLLLSPWIIIPYTDTLSMVFPILVFYIYISTDKWWKYGLIVFFSLIGFFIKPTVIIILIAIIITELFKYRPKIPKPNKDFYLHLLSIVNGILLALLVKEVSFSYINYQPIEGITQANYVHFLAMGQNEETCGQYHTIDHEELDKGTNFEWQKFCDRISSRSPIEHINFFSRKLLLNFDDGTFAWAREGNFYSEVPERDNPISNTLANLFYDNGENYKIFEQFEQMIWLFVLFGGIFVFNKHQSKKETVLQLSTIGVFLFVMLFEARSRYLLCFAPMFVICALLGYHRLVNSITTYVYEEHKKTAKSTHSN